MSKRYFAALAAPFVLLASLALAQTVTTGETVAPTETTTQPLADTVTLPAWPTAGVALTDDSQAVAASFALGAVSGIDAKLLSGVTANGYARKVVVDDQSIGQVLITSVAKDGKTEAISAEGLTAQFDTSKSSELFPEKSVEVQGSKAALIAALEKLAVSDPKKEEAPAKTEEAAAMTTSGGSSNDLASDYKTPTSTAKTAAEEADPVTTYMTTTEGCSIRVDAAAGSAFVQSKVQTFTDGVLTGETACSDSASFPLKQSYLACGDEVDLTEMKAWSKYTLYYTDTSGENHTVSECAKDAETYYAITEDEGKCSLYLDFQDSQAVPQSALVYTNRNNAVVQARGCEDSTLTAPIAMAKSTSGCTIRHDYAEGRSYEQSMWSYVRDGVNYVASACSDDGVTFDHETVYTDATGEYVCKPVIDTTNGTAVLQSRKAITVSGTLQYIAECTPDSTATAVIATTEGCTDYSTWTHDISAGVSYGQERFYLLNPDGARRYVTACQSSNETYIHDHELTGYQYHDDQLYAYPLSTVSINVGGNKYVIANSTVLDGASQFPYTLNGTATQQTGESIYEGCSGYYITALSEKWQRPDATVYLKAIGDGTPAGPRNVCNTPTVLNTLSVIYAVGGSSYGDPSCGVSCNSEGDGCQTITRGGVIQSGRIAGHYEKTNFETNELVSNYYEWSGQTYSVGALVCGGSNGALQYYSFPYFSFRAPDVANGWSSGDRVPNVPTGW